MGGAQTKDDIADIKPLILKFLYHLTGIEAMKIDTFSSGKRKQT